MTHLKNSCAVCSHWNMKYKTDSIDERRAALMKRRLCLLNPSYYGLIYGYNSCNYFKKSAWCEKMLNEVR